MPDQPERSQKTLDLVRRAQGGDQEGFNALYARLAPALLAWMRLRLPASLMARHGPEDLMHEVWWKALDAFSGYDPERATFRAWLFTISRRVFISTLRRAEVATRAGFPPGHHAAGDRVPHSVTDVSRRVARDQVLAQILEALGRLDETDRMIFVHCGLEGDSAAHVADLVGLSRDAVLKRWQRLRERIRRDIPEGERLLDDWNP